MKEAHGHQPKQHNNNNKITTKKHKERKKNAYTHTQHAFVQIEWAMKITTITTTTTRKKCNIFHVNVHQSTWVYNNAVMSVAHFPHQIRRGKGKKSSLKYTACISYTLCVCVCETRQPHVAECQCECITAEGIGRNIAKSLNGSN